MSTGQNKDREIGSHWFRETQLTITFLRFHGAFSSCLAVVKVNSHGLPLNASYLAWIMNLFTLETMMFFIKSSSSTREDYKWRSCTVRLKICAKLARHSEFLEEGATTRLHNAKPSNLLWFDAVPCWENR